MQPYDPLLIPPDFSLCNDHAKAARCRPTTNEMPICGCCSRRISHVEFALELDFRKIVNRIGMGTVLMFEHLKVYGYMSLAIFLLYGIPSIVTNFLGNYCKDPSSQEQQLKCRSDLIAQSSFLNKIDKNSYVFVQGVSGIATTFVLLGIMYYWQRNLK
jgi:hypothetical protein